MERRAVPRVDCEGMVGVTSILCPVDFSPHAAAALRQAAALAARWRAELTVAWVTDPLLAQAAAVYAIDPGGDETRADLQAFVAEALARQPAAQPPRLVLAVGKADEEILGLAHQQGAGLIVMGTHGLSGARRMFVGSTTERVLRRTDIPVLAVPIADSASTAAIERIETIVIAIDLESETSTLASFGANLARAFDARPVFIHVMPPATAVPTRWRAAMERHETSAVEVARAALSRVADDAGAATAEVIVSAGHPAEEIASLAVSQRAALIVMGLANPSGLFSPRPGSIASRVLALAPVPVLVVPAAHS
jgi:nucleotide-binding universal stress UspA family protein